MCPLITVCYSFLLFQATHQDHRLGDKLISLLLGDSLPNISEALSAEQILVRMSAAMRVDVPGRGGLLP
jgi:hypothetical protein